MKTTAAVKSAATRKKRKSSNALTRVRKYFPNVQRVRDANRSINIRVTPEDSKTGARKDPSDCALARAACREGIADSAIIGIGFSYLIKKNVATRYQTSVGVGREIVSFDRHQDFAPGIDYALRRPCKSARLGKKQWDKTGPHKTDRPGPLSVHHTANIRVLKKP